ncbi:hypothetical protein [Xanthocytophaga agilis]|uniref:Uncharacterized protein n=1 Tax=Xanthocytophaga agilis TaxID=3048010 RepID=A0AAE3UC22_9BACT|nr:hypothetical protein [Xanthocytophaga agilis]MDJ1500458.1 hypothetical protein [Xanthocytophaga agilis]
MEAFKDYLDFLQKRFEQMKQEDIEAEKVLREQAARYQVPDGYMNIKSIAKKFKVSLTRRQKLRLIKHCKNVCSEKQIDVHMAMDKFLLFPVTIIKEALKDFNFL